MPKILSDYSLTSPTTDILGTKVVPEQRSKQEQFSMITSQVTQFWIFGLRGFSTSHALVYD